MPIFEFDCRSCGHYFEFFIRSSTDEPRCPQCKGRKLGKRVSLFGFSSGSSTAVRPVASGCSGCSGGNCGGCSH